MIYMDNLKITNYQVLPVDHVEDVLVNYCLK